MRLILLALSFIGALCFCGDEGLSVNQENARYLTWRGKTTVLIGSTEHYGAVLNSEFDYVKYLDTLQRDGLNQTRTFSGIYCEGPESFKIAGNTLAPAQGKFICPWARSDQPGYKGGGNKFDLDKWDDKYFARLKDFMTKAGERGIIVEFVLFCPFYEDHMWVLSPLHPANNVNKTPDAKRTEVYALMHDAFSGIQDKMIRKLVDELNPFDNFYFEICNEPYFGGVTEKFQRFVADTITAAEQGKPKKHLIAQNIANGKAQIKNPIPSVRIFNFHYATPPDVIGMNYMLNRCIGDDETGFKGTDDFTYRREAWEFIVAGGGTFDHLDYSFSVGHEAGDFTYPKTQPGGGSAMLRASYKILKEFIHTFEIAKLHPDAVAIRSVEPKEIKTRCISQPGVAYGIYLHGGKKATLKLAVPIGSYSVEWIDPISGKTQKSEVTHKNGDLTLESPEFAEDAALKLIRK